MESGTYNGQTLTFSESMKNRMGIGVPEQNATDTYERGMDIVPGCIKANDKEIPVKQYNIAILRNLLKFERAEGRLQLTSRRVIFRAAGRSLGGRITLQHEFAIDEIAGIEARRNYKFSFLYLIFAALIISFSYFVITGKPPIFSAIMSPSHVQKARQAEYEAVLQRDQAQQLENQATLERKNAEEKEKRAIKTRETAEKNEKSPPQYYYYIDYKQARVNAQNAERKAIADREAAEKVEKQAVAQRELAELTAREATEKRASVEKTWTILMTLLGLILGIGGLIPFFALYKRFGLKLLILNLSVFGFLLSSIASGNPFHVFDLLLLLSIITILVCMFLFCFRPNLVISIKNKGAKGTVDISKKTGFAEIIPTDETESAIREIGAIIGDIHASGELAVKRWTEKNVETAKPPISGETGVSVKNSAGIPPLNTFVASNQVQSSGNPDRKPVATFASSNPPQSSGNPGKKHVILGIAAGVVLLITVVSAAVVFLLMPGHKDLYAKGKAYLDAENYAEAVKYLSKAISARPTEAQYYYVRGTAHLSKEIYGEAIADFTEAIRLDPENAPYRFERASVYYAIKEYDKAISDYTEAIRLDPSDARYYNSRGNSYRIKEQYGRAIEDHDAAIKLNPDDPRYHNNLGVAYLLSKDYDNAAAAYTEAIKLAPDNARYYNNRGGAYNLKKDFESAAADFTEAARLDPDNSEYAKNLEKAISDQSRSRR